MHPTAHGPSRQARRPAMGMFGQLPDEVCCRAAQANVQFDHRPFLRALDGSKALVMYAANAVMVHVQDSRSLVVFACLDKLFAWPSAGTGASPAWTLCGQPVSRTMFLQVLSLIWSKAGVRGWASLLATSRTVRASVQICIQDAKKKEARFEKLKSDLRCAPIICVTT